MIRYLIDDSITESNHEDVAKPSESADDFDYAACEPTDSSLRRFDPRVERLVDDALRDTHLVINVGADAVVQVEHR